MTTTRTLLEQLNDAIHDAEIEDSIPHDLVLAVCKHLAPCSDDCPGWEHFSVGTEREGIMSCDHCNRYETDFDAATAHSRHCRCGMGVIEPSERCHVCARSIDDIGPLAVTSDHRLTCEQCRNEAALDLRRVGIK